MPQWLVSVSRCTRSLNTQYYNPELAPLPTTLDNSPAGASGSIHQGIVDDAVERVGIKIESAVYEYLYSQNGESAKKI